MNVKCIIWLLLCKNSLSTKNEILTTLERESWISDEDFETILKVSFPVSDCCNIYLNESTKSMNDLFHKFIKVYPFDYNVLEKTYICKAYLLFATTDALLIKALKAVPSKISTTELLIVFDGNITEESPLFNASLYNNANVNLVSPSGMWSLSENYIERRKFDKVKRYKDLAYKSGVANMNGRKLQAATFYNPPMCYLRRTVNKTVNGIEGEFFLADDNHEKDGIEFKIFMLLAERLNFTWSIRTPTGGYRYGRQSGNSWKGGMIGQLINKEIDIAFSGIWLKEDQYVVTNLSTPWQELFITFLVPRPQPYTSFWALTRPFSPGIWVSVLMIVLLFTFYMNIRSWLHPESPKRFRSFINTLTELIGRLLGIWVPKNTRGARMQLNFWQLAGLLIVAAYSCSLAASLARSLYDERIDDIRQFVQADLTWGRQGQTPIFNDYFDLSDPYCAQLPSRFKLEESDEDRHQRILEGKYAIIGRRVSGVFFPEGNVTNKDLEGYRVMESIVGNYYSSFAVQPWLLQHVDTVILHLRESGISLFHERDVIRRRTGISLREVLEEHDTNDDSARVLSLTPLAAGFSILAVGLFIATIVFCFELRSDIISRGNRAKLQQGMRGGKDEEKRKTELL